MPLDMKVGYDPVAKRVVMLRTFGPRVTGQIAALSVQETQELVDQLQNVLRFTQGAEPATVAPVPEVSAEFGTHPEPLFDVEGEVLSDQCPACDETDADCLARGGCCEDCTHQRSLLAWAEATASSRAREAMEHPERYEVVRGPQGVAQLRRKPGA